MDAYRATIVVALTAFVSACATVSTEVVKLKPGLKLEPSRGVEILLDRPQRPYREIALLESRGMVGDSESALWQDDREKAQALGADALVRLDLERTVHSPMVMYDPFFSPFYSPYSPHHDFFGPHWSEYRVIPGGVAYTLRTLAIKFESAKKSGRENSNALPERRVTLHSEHMGDTLRPLRGEAKCRGRSAPRWTNGFGLWRGYWKARRWQSCAGSSISLARQATRSINDTRIAASRA